MRVIDLYEALEQSIPSSLSCAWDHDGLMVCPDPDLEVRRALVCLDATDRMMEYAIRHDCQLILCHHPLLFHGLQALDPRDGLAQKCMDMVQNRVAVFSFHTRLDALPGGVNDCLAQTIGLQRVEPFLSAGLPIGRIGEWTRGGTLSDFLEHVKAVLHVPVLRVGDAGKAPYRVAILGGSGKDDVENAKAAGADTFLSGELGYHQLTDAAYTGMNLIAAGHFFTEDPVCAALERMLRDLDSSMDVVYQNSNRVNWI